VKILDGIRVLDLGSYIAAPYCGMLLGELGAEVIKVERPGAADPSRNVVVNGRSTVFNAFNRNKRGIALDYAKPAGRAVLDKMVGQADVLIINVRPGVEKKIGVDAARLQAINPRLVHCAITGFGADGPYAHRPVYDNVGQALSGVSSRFHQGSDARVGGTAMSDNITGMQACIGILGALVERGRTGRGRRVEVNLLEANMAFAIEPMMHFLSSGEVPGFFYRGGVSQAYVVTCKDGKRIGLHLSNSDKFWENFTNAIGQPEMGRRYAAAPQRVSGYGDIAAELARVFGAHDRAHWLPLLEAHDVPHGAEHALDEIESDPQVKHLQSFAPVDASAWGTDRVPRRVVRFDGDNHSTFRPAPAVGGDSDEILAELGLDAAAIAALRSDGLIG